MNAVAIDFVARCVQPAGAAGRFGLTTDCRSWLRFAERLRRIARTLGEMANAHYAESTDAACLAKVLEQFKAWDHGSNIKPDVGAKWKAC